MFKSEASSAEKNYFTLDETADYFQVSRRTVERLTDSGQLPYLRAGRAIRIPVRSIRAYERANLETPGYSPTARQRILDAICGAEVTR